MTDAPLPVRGRTAVAQGLAAARANLLPAVLLNVVAVAIALNYAWLPAFRDGLVWLSELRRAASYTYAMIATALFGAVAPFFLIRLGRGDNEPWRALPYLTLIWAVKGAEVNLLYDLQARWFGDGRDWTTVLIKTAVDQGLYVPLWACPTLVLLYRFKQHDFAPRALAHELDRGWYRRRVVPVLIMNMVIWVPTVLCIYSLPTELQLPMQNVVLCLFVVLLAFMTGDQRDDRPRETQP